MKASVTQEKLAKALNLIKDIASSRNELPNMKNDQDVAVIIFSAEVLSMPHKDLKQTIKNLFSQAQLYK